MSIVKFAHPKTDYRCFPVRVQQWGLMTKSWCFGAQNLTFFFLFSSSLCWILFRQVEKIGENHLNDTRVWGPVNNPSANVGAQKSSHVRKHEMFSILRSDEPSDFDGLLFLSPFRHDNKNTFFFNKTQFWNFEKSVEKKPFPFNTSMKQDFSLEKKKSN